MDLNETVLLKFLPMTQKIPFRVDKHIFIGFSVI
jgi:hypothetical protein